MSLIKLKLSQDMITEIFRFVLDNPGKKDYDVCVNDENGEVCISNQQTSKLIYFAKHNGAPNEITP